MFWQRGALCSGLWKEQIYSTVQHLVAFLSFKVKKPVPCQCQFVVSSRKLLLCPSIRQWASFSILPGRPSDPWLCHLSGVDWLTMSSIRLWPRASGHDGWQVVDVTSIWMWLCVVHQLWLCRLADCARVIHHGVATGHVIWQAVEAWMWRRPGYGRVARQAMVVSSIRLWTCCPSGTVTVSAFRLLLCRPSGCDRVVHQAVTLSSIRLWLSSIRLWLVHPSGCDFVIHQAVTLSSTRLWLYRPSGWHHVV